MDSDEKINLNIEPTPIEWYATNSSSPVICSTTISAMVDGAANEIVRETPDGEFIFAEGENWETAFRKLWSIVKAQSRL